MRVIFGVLGRSTLLCILGVLLIAGCSGESGSRGADEGKGTGTGVSGAGTAVGGPGQGKLHFDSGISNLYEKKYDAAIEEFEQSLKYNPHSPSTLNNIGFAYFDKGDMDSAIEYHARALETEPGFANAYYGLALALESRGSTEGAIMNWKEFLGRSEPGSKWAQKAEAHIEALEKGAKQKAEEGAGNGAGKETKAETE